MQLLEAKIIEKLNELITTFYGSFADKKDCQKKFSGLAKDIKSLFELLLQMKQNHSKGDEEDAMFTKKPLGGTSCASCERNITNLSGLMADFQPWKKLPFRELNDRIAKYGQGFSKMLSMLGP